MALSFRIQHRRFLTLSVYIIVVTLLLLVNNWVWLQSSERMLICPSTSPLLIGRSNISEFVASGWRHHESRYSVNPVRLGGHYTPDGCRPQSKIAIIVPYRDRTIQLNIFLAYMHPYLQRQQLDYVIFVIEQAGTIKSPFNRGKLMNIGFKEAMDRQVFDCFIFHDVDLLPEDDRNPHTCPEVGMPRHLSVSIDIFGYIPIGENHFGGVVSMATADFVAVNGFSNSFWGWGGEDDDLFQRIRARNLTVQRHRPLRESRYTMLPHDPAEPNPNRKRILKQNDGAQSDGLANLKYRRLNVQLNYLFTRIIVEIMP